LFEGRELPLAYLHIEDAVLFDFETQSGLDLVETIGAGGARVEDQHIVALVVHHLQYVGVAADEDVRAGGFYHLKGPVVVFAGVAAYVGHQNFPTLHFKNLCRRVAAADFGTVTIAVDGFQSLEGGPGVGRLDIAEISGVPEFFDWLQKLFYTFVHESVGVGYNTNVHNCAQ